MRGYQQAPRVHEHKGMRMWGCKETNKHYSLIVMNTFKGQDNTEIISHKFNTWCADRANEQLKKGVAPGDVKVSMKMSDLKPLQAHWIVDMYTHLKQQKKSIQNGFDKVCVTESVKSANEVFARIEKSFSLKNEQMKRK